MKTISEIIKNLRQEYHALKVSFAASANNIPLVAKTLNFATSKNACRYSSGGIAFNYEDNERVVVTLDTSTGSNTLANLEISGDFTTPPVVRRVPYSGGARWIVMTAPKYSGGNWTATNYHFQVLTLVNGTLSAKMIWE